MDYTSLFVVLAIVAYGFNEYHRREALHKIRLAYLQRGLAPPEEAKRVEFWRVLTTGGVALLLAGMVAALFMLEFRTGVKFGPFASVGLLFGLLFVLVFLLFVNTAIRYLHQSAERKAR